MGTPDFAVAPLKHLVDNGYNIVAVVTAPDKPAGRGQKIQESAVKQYAEKAGLKVLQPTSLKSISFIEEFNALHADLGIVIAFRMLPEVIWRAPRLGTFNLHASLLPRYRGAAPINWAIINGENTTGVTTFFINSEIDKGDILLQRAETIESDDTAGTMHDKLMYLGADLVLETVEMIAAGDFRQTPQVLAHPDRLREAPKIFKEICKIDWTGTCAEIHDFVRGLSPYPAAWCELRKEGGEATTIKVFSVETAFEEHSEKQGTVSSDGISRIRVTCADGYIFLSEVQAAGKNRMSVAEFLRGFKVASDI